MKIPFVIYGDMECFLEKVSSCDNEQTNHSHQEQINICRVVIHYSPTAHLIATKTNMVFTEEKTLRGSFVKI